MRVLLAYDAAQPLVRSHLTKIKIALQSTKFRIDLAKAIVSQRYTPSGVNRQDEPQDDIPDPLSWSLIPNVG
jgi:hypothetical protein